jgi:hypothetical protein
MGDGLAYSGSADSALIAGAKIQVLDLHAIQTRLGSKWQRMSTLVHKYFEAAIKSELGPRDVFCHRGELEYLVAFHDTPLAEARLKCMAISQFACERLFGKDGEELVVRALTAPVDPADYSSFEDQKRVDQILEEQGEQFLCNRSGEKAKSPPRRIIGVSLGDERRHQICAEQTPFVFRPFWDSDRQVLLSYLAQPFPETCLPTVRFFGPATAVPVEPVQSELDIICLNAARQRIRAVRRAGGRLLVATPLHFTTLSRQRYWLRYREFASSIDPEDFADVLFVLHGIEDGVPNVRLIQELPKLAFFSRRIFCLAQSVSQLRRQFHNTNVQAVGLVARPGEPERLLIERLQKLHNATRAAGMESFLLGATKRSIVINAIGAGIRYIEGGGMRRAIAEPKFAVAQDLADYCRMTSKHLSPA